MSINMEKFINIIQPTKQGDMITDLIRNYLVLKYRINHLDKQNFYFRAAMESNNNKLNKFKEEYEQHMKKCNELTPDRLLELLTESEIDYKEKMNKRITPYFARAITLGQCESRIHTLKAYLQAKSKFNVLLPIDDYEKNEELLNKIFLV